MKLHERITRLEALHSPPAETLTVAMPEWQLPTAADRDAWKAEHVAPLRDRCKLLVVVRRLTAPEELGQAA